MEIIIGFIAFILIIYLLTRKKKHYEIEKFFPQSKPETSPINNLSEIEKQFFEKLNSFKQISKLPGEFKYTKSTGGYFTVYYNELLESCYVGKVKLCVPTIKYAVIKSGNTKASKIFSSLEGAKNYIQSHSKFTYEIKENMSKEDSFIQYSTNLDESAKYIYVDNPQNIFLYIPYWIKYIEKIRQNF